MLCSLCRHEKQITDMTNVEGKLLCTSCKNIPEICPKESEEDPFLMENEGVCKCRGACDVCIKTYGKPFFLNKKCHKCIQEKGALSFF
jgi:hypothetical protein